MACSNETAGGRQRRAVTVVGPGRDVEVDGRVAHAW